MSKKYVRDEVRNARAADLLLLLASEEPALPDSLVAQIADCPGLLSAVREVGRQVGFSLFPVTLAQFLDASLRAAKSNEGRPR